MPSTVTSGGVLLDLPGTPDTNHIDGIGTIFLLAHYPIPRDKPWDLRDASIEISARAKNLDLHGGKVAWWIVSNTGENKPGLPYEQANWALTGSPLQIGEKFKSISTVLRDDESLWTYAGHNTSTQGVWGDRYGYMPLSKALSNVDATLHLVIIGGPDGRPPEGQIEINSVTINLGKPAPQREEDPGKTAISYADDVVPLLELGNFAGAEPLLRSLADAGHAGAALHLGNILRYGRLGVPDFVEARHYYQIAAASEPGASIELARLYLEGLGVPRDPMAALGHLSRKELLNQPRAQYLRSNLCLSLSIPLGCDHLQLLESAANSGSARAVVDLAATFAKNGATEDAKKWAAVAASLNLDEPRQAILQEVQASLDPVGQASRP